MEKEEIVKKLGNKIRKLRLLKNWTQEELANKLGYSSRSTINKIEKGLVDLSQTRLLDFAKVFNITLDNLLGLYDENSIYDGKITITTSEESLVFYMPNQDALKVINFIQTMSEEQ